MKKVLSIAFLSILVLTLFIPSILASSNLTLATQGCPNNYTQEEINSGETLWISGGNFSAGFHRIKITGTENSCHPNQVIWGEYDLHKGDSGEICMNVKKIKDDECGEYILKISNTEFHYNVYNPKFIPVVPEFGLIAGLTTIIGAIAALFVIRRN